MNIIKSAPDWNDTRPVPRGFFAQYFEFEIDRKFNGTSIVELCPAITDEFIGRIRERPNLLYELEPRQFEELIARVFEAFGFEVELTARTRDGGRDLIAISNFPSRIKYLIECKRYSPERRVGIDVVQRLHGVVIGEPSTAGILATTSGFMAAVAKPVEIGT
jgi:restriction system protein